MEKLRYDKVIQLAHVHIAAKSLRSIWILICEVTKSAFLTIALYCFSAKGEAVINWMASNSSENERPLGKIWWEWSCGLGDGGCGSTSTLKLKLVINQLLLHCHPSFLHSALMSGHCLCMELTNLSSMTVQGTHCIFTYPLHPAGSSGCDRKLLCFSQFTAWTPRGSDLWLLLCSDHMLRCAVV